MLLVDAGDLFQGTLESNLNEGATVVDAYNALGYAAATIGNHEFDYGPDNPMHKSAAQAKDGALVQDVQDPTHFWLIGEWADIVEHARIRKILAEEMKPAFVGLIKGKGFVPFYAKVVSATPQDILDKASTAQA